MPKIGGGEIVEIIISHDDDYQLSGIASTYISIPFRRVAYVAGKSNEICIIHDLSIIIEFRMKKSPHRVAGT